MENSLPLKMTLNEKKDNPLTFDIQTKHYNKTLYKCPIVTSMHCKRGKVSPTLASLTK